MKIGIIGSYGGTSIGDEAILRGLLNLLSRYSTKIEKVLIFTNNSTRTNNAINFSKYPFDIELIDIRGKSNTKSAVKNGLYKNEIKKILVNLWLNFHKNVPIVPGVINKVRGMLMQKNQIYKDVFNDLDFIIFGGGNVLMDLYPAWIDFLNNIFITARKGKKRVYFLGVGAGPLKTKRGKKLIKKLGDDFYISVRDRESKSTLEKINASNIYLGTDLAIGNYNINNNEQTKGTGIGVTVVPYFANYYWPESNKEYYQNYKANMANILDTFIEKSNKKVEFFATNYPADILAANEIREMMEYKDMVCINDKEMSVEEIISFIQSKELILGTRLHSLILSYISNIDFFAFNYQPKVNYFLNRLGKSNDFIDVTELSTHRLTEDLINENAKKIINRSSNPDLQSVLNQDYENLIKEMEKIING
jgi:polysaccharide pyruvyl transferase WcaK-like protein